MYRYEARNVRDQGVRKSEGGGLESEIVMDEPIESAGREKVVIWEENIRTILAKDPPEQTTSLKCRRRGDGPGGIHGRHLASPLPVVLLVQHTFTAIYLAPKPQLSDVRTAIEALVAKAGVNREGRVSGTIGSGLRTGVRR